MKKLLKITFTLIFTTILLLGFALPLNPVGNWYQQFLPSIGNRQISDITFTDSLNGYAVTNRLSLTDTSFILRTTNGGDNWLFARSDSGVIYNNIQFINQNTGFVSGYIYVGGSFKIVKTTNMGSNWFYINAPFDAAANDMFVLNSDTLFLVVSENLTGGVFKTTNGGLNWTVNNTIKPDKIYMLNSTTGFCSRVQSYLYKTTTSGTNWNLITGTRGFTDIKFVDVLTGWKCSNINGIPYFEKTTNGGLNWFNQVIPHGGIIITSQVYCISILNSDTVWAAGGEAFYGAGQFRGVLFRTTNGGNNWLFNVPDTTIHLSAYTSIQFINKQTGWVYNSYGGIHTTNGGDTTFTVGLQQINGEIPIEYNLLQNYPNPFNPVTNIKFDIPKRSNVKISIYDILGKEISVLVNEELNPGTFEVNWDASNFPSGVYFYKIVTDSYSESRKMVLVK